MGARDSPRSPSDHAADPPVRRSRRDPGSWIRAVLLDAGNTLRIQEGHVGTEPHLSTGLGDLLECVMDSQVVGVEKPDDLARAGVG